MAGYVIIKLKIHIIQCSCSVDPYHRLLFIDPWYSASDCLNRVMEPYHCLSHENTRFARVLQGSAVYKYRRTHALHDTCLTPLESAVSPPILLGIERYLRRWKAPFKCFPKRYRFRSILSSISRDTALSRGVTHVACNACVRRFAYWWKKYIITTKMRYNISTGPHYKGS